MDNLVFFFNDTATTEIYTLSLHDALPIWTSKTLPPGATWSSIGSVLPTKQRFSTSKTAPSRFELISSGQKRRRSEEHTSELQSRQYLVCRLLLEKKKTAYVITLTNIFTSS